MNTSTRQVTSEERFVIFMLSCVDSIGSETIKKADERLHSISDIFGLSDSELKSELGFKDCQIKGFNAVRKERSRIEKEYEVLQSSGIGFYTFKDPDYPERLLKIKQNPAVIYSYGSLPDDNVPSVGIVGSRACTCYGSSAAEHLGEALADSGVNIISGMAVGIDAAAHRGALRSVNGKTYAVLAGGVNVIYPRRNRYIYDEIISSERGGIISEMIPGKAAISCNFPMRNRIISGLSDLIVVVEAREKSGSLITAGYAASQNIPVMAVPGRITDPMSRGTNMLILQGCGIVTGMDAVLRKLNLKAGSDTPGNTEKENILDNKEKIVYSTLVSGTKHIESILRESALSRDETMESLISLELKGFIRQVSSNYYMRS